MSERKKNPVAHTRGDPSDRCVAEKRDWEDVPADQRDDPEPAGVPARPLGRPAASDTACQHHLPQDTRRQVIPGPVLWIRIRIGSVFRS